MAKFKNLIIVFLLNFQILYSQGSSAHWDAIHAFDEPHRGSTDIGIGEGILKYIISLIIIIILAGYFGQKKNNSNK